MRQSLLFAAATGVLTLMAQNGLGAQSGTGAALPAAGAQAARAQNLDPATSSSGLATALASVHASNPGLGLPAATAFSTGERTVAAGSSVSGAAVADGALHVFGRVLGDAVAYRGDVVLHEGGEVAGNAIAILGRVRLEGGQVAGDVRAFSGDLRATEPAASQSPARATASAVALAAGWLAVLALVGIGVLVFASPNLDAVTDALERDFTRAFLTGIAGQLAVLPGLALVCVGLALTVLGILLIPFAVVAYVLAVAGLLTLGYLALSRIAGRILVGASPMGERERRVAALRGMIAGLLVLMLPWFVSALLAWSPAANLAVRMAAVALSWVACTAGLGAALLSRGGVRRVSALAAQRAMATASWQTPTPVAGVAAARRPTPIATSAVK